MFSRKRRTKIQEFTLPGQFRPGFMADVLTAVLEAASPALVDLRIRGQGANKIEQADADCLDANANVHVSQEISELSHRRESLEREISDLRNSLAGPLDLDIAKARPPAVKTMARLLQFPNRR